MHRTSRSCSRLILPSPLHRGFGKISEDELRYGKLGKRSKCQIHEARMHVLQVHMHCEGMDHTSEAAQATFRAALKLAESPVRHGPRRSRRGWRSVRRPGHNAAAAMRQSAVLLRAAWHAAQSTHQEILLVLSEKPPACILFLRDVL